MSGHAGTEAQHHALLTTVADFLPWPHTLIDRPPESLVRMPLLDIARITPPPLDQFLAMRVSRAFTA